MRIANPRAACFALTCVTLSLLAACAGSPAQEGADAAAEEAGRLGREQIADTVRATMDPTADPCQDFYQYSCGGWLAETEKPADQPRWARSFSVIRKTNSELVQTILEEVAAEPGEDPVRQRVGHYFGSCMDMEARNAAGTAPLAPVLQEIAAVEDVAGFMGAVGTLHRKGLGGLFGAASLPDFKSSDLVIALYSQGGLGLPDRDYYFRDDEKSAGLREAYQAHIARMLGLLGEAEEEAAAHAAAAYAFETELAEVSRDAAAMRDIANLYNRLDIEGLKELTPSLPWDAFHKSIGYPETEQINVATPEFFERLEDLLAETPVETLTAYLRWNAINAAAGSLGEEAVAANFDFYGKALQGQEEMEPLWQRCVDSTDNALGEAVGRLFVERAFAGDSKQIALEMIRDVQSAFRAELPNLAWMDETTRQRAVEKAEAMRNKIGYPDAWRDYSSLAVESGDYFGNVLAAAEFEYRRNRDKEGQPVDRSEWFMTPPTVNAYNNPLGNEMVFPAGILQPPFFHRDFPAAMNYGAMGVVMGHELTHGFDDSGRKFDAKGQLADWWAEDVGARFDERAACVRDLYDGYEIEPGLTLNGQLTLGENIADLGGVKQAHNAYRAWVAEHGAEEPLLAELTDEQLFFVSFGQIWCQLATPEFERLHAQTNPHSHGRYRTIGPLSNTPAFAEAFGCEPGTPMHREEMCEVW